MAHSVRGVHPFSLSHMITPDPGSFKDPSGRVYRVTDDNNVTHILRGLDANAGAVATKLLATPFFQTWIRKQSVVATTDVTNDPIAAPLTPHWHTVLEHAPVPFLTMPYEWCFSMLKDAALLTLDLFQQAIDNHYLLKDATPYNIQFNGIRPVFIDIPSFQPRGEFDYWRGYRQFSAEFLVPLLLDAHCNIAFHALLRACPSGIAPLDAAKYFYGLRVFKRGVLSHVWFPAYAERRALRRGVDTVSETNTTRGQPAIALRALVDSLSRLIRTLHHRNASTGHWSQYTRTHSYDADSYAQKKNFIDRHAAALCPRLAWDLGANTGEFARIVASHAQHVIAADTDHDSIEALYRSLRNDGVDNITPLLLDVANPSPSQGWACAERPAFAQRSKPDFVICLALLHHLRVSANVPLAMVIEWLASLRATVVLEWVGRKDTMFRALVMNKTEEYGDYTLPAFETEVGKWFTIEDRLVLKDGMRELFLLVPKGTDLE